MRNQRVRLLVSLFQSRFFEDDSASPGGGFQANINQVLGFLVAAGLFVAYFLTPPFVKLSLRGPSPETEWALRSFHLFFPAYSFAIVGFATVFQWDMLFPDRRDFLILTPFPIALRELVIAKIAALLRFLLLVTAAVNLVPNGMVILLSIAMGQLHGTGFRLVAAQVSVSAGASIFAFFAVAAFQGCLIQVTSVRVFRRISPWIQMIGMSLMVLSLLTYPIYSLLLRSAAQNHALWPWLFPPCWFSGLYDLILSGKNQLFVDLGLLALKMLAAVIVIFSLTWAVGFRRHYRRTLEVADVPSRMPAWNYGSRLIRPPAERAIFDFSGKTLARSQKHQFFLATYMSVGISIGLLFAVAVRGGTLVWNQYGLRSFPFILSFFAISGLRGVFQFPADLAANWLFRMTEAGWTELSRSATRKRTFVSALVPVLLLALPLEVITGGWRYVAVHFVFQLLAGALLIELMFWSFGKVPFTCSYFPGSTNLAILVFFYMYGFTGFGFNMADLELVLEGRTVQLLLCFAAAILLLKLSWHRRAAPEPIQFDGEKPAIQALDLS